MYGQVNKCPLLSNVYHVECVQFYIISRYNEITFLKEDPFSSDTNHCKAENSAQLGKQV